jgi:Reverse transcriptase (RNA-dependent DNA polymerase)
LWADLISKGFEVSKSSPCLFKRRGKKLYLLIYVGDILVIGPDEKEIAQAKKILSELYEVKSIGVAKYFLGFAIHQDDDDSMSLNQPSYIKRTCDRYKMGDAKPVISPTEMGQSSKLRSGEPSTAESQSI